MTNVIICIHGLANKPEPEVLSDWWEKAIREGLNNRGVAVADFKFVMVHWAKFLYKNLQHQDSDFDFDPLYLNQPYIKAVDGALKRYDEGIGDRIRGWGTDIAGNLMGKIRGPLGLSAIEDRLLEPKVRDPAYYYDENQQLKDGAGCAVRRGRF